MFKAIQRVTGEEIISLSPEWRGRLSDLRAQTHLDLLVCQACNQPLRLKAGPRRRPHFAHKHLQSCSFGSQSPAILEARGMVYEHMLELFPGLVELEKIMPGSGLPRAVDVWVKASPRPFCLWVVDTTLKLEARESIRQVFSQAECTLIWVLCIQMLRKDPKSSSRVLLSPTERDLMRPTPYDEIGRESHISGEDFGGSLHYLDVEAGTLLTLRALERMHAPNVYSGRQLKTPLSQVRVNPLVADLVHPGEDARLSASRAERGRRVERIQRFLKPDVPAQNMPDPAQGWLSARTGRLPEESRRHWQSGAPREADQAAVCVHCGQATTDWWQAWWEGEIHRCKCRACLEKGLE